MKLLLVFFLFSVSNAFAIDTGDGSDGVCTNASFLLAKRNYQCTSLTINAPLNLFKAVGGPQVVIKVQNFINITGTGSIDLSGGDGIGGDTSSHSGGTAGAGGGDGGASQVGADGLNGAGTAAGLGVAGTFDSDPVGSYGGGGGGGSCRTKDTDEPYDGFNSSGSNTSKGSNGTAFLTSSASFDTSFAGGPGGAAGGGGSDGTTPVSGSSGGGGGGALRLVAGGDIMIAGTITANGGKGGGTLAISSSGGGGGGAGGAVWIQAAGTLTITGTITASGGIGGTNDYGASLPPSGLGGDGGKGAIRLDDGVGTPTVGAGVDAGYFTNSFTPTKVSTSTVSLSRDYVSGVSCGSVTLDDHEKPYNNFVNIILGFAIAALLHFTVSRKSKV